MPIQAIQDSRLSKSDLRVLAALHYRNGPKGCFPSRADIAELTGLLPHKISAATSRLRRFGWVDKDGYKYLLKVPEPGTSTQFEEVPEVGTQEVPESGTPSTRSGYSKVPEVGTRNRTEENNRTEQEENTPCSPPEGDVVLSAAEPGSTPDQPTTEKPERYAAEVREVIEHLNRVTDSQYRFGEGNAKHIRARLNDGMTVDDLNAVTEFKAREWLPDPKFAKYLRPETLFGSKCEGYLSAARRQPVARKFSDATVRSAGNLQGFAHG